MTVSFKLFYGLMDKEMKVFIHSKFVEKGYGKANPTLSVEH